MSHHGVRRALCVALSIVLLGPAALAGRPEGQQAASRPDSGGPIGLSVEPEDLEGFILAL